MLRAVNDLPAAARPDWERIDTVCLDMDGTVLDQRFDNLFWLEVLPRRWAEANGVSHAEGTAELVRRFEAKRGTLEWYCVDHWSEDLGLDLATLKHDLRHEIRYLEGAVAFLEHVRALGKRLLLTTNAHPISLAVKEHRTGLSRHFDELVSSHEFGVAKESAGFWARLAASHAVDPASTLFVDDSAAVIEAARTAGVLAVYQVLRPDSTLPPRDPLAGVAAIGGLADLIPR